MSKRFSILLVVLTIVSGLIGGLISGRIFAVNSAQAVETKQSKVLTTEELRIVDKDGKLLMKLGKGGNERVLELGEYGLFLYDQVGLSCAEFGWSGLDKIPYLQLIGIIDSKSNVLSMLPSHLKVTGKENISAYFGISKSGNSLINVSGKGDKGRAEMTVNADGGMFNVYSKSDDRARASMLITKDDKGILGAFNKDNRGRAEVSVNEYGGYLNVSGKGDNVKAEMTVNENGGIFNVFGKIDNLARASMQITKDDQGLIGAFNKDNRGRAEVSVNEYGGRFDSYGKVDNKSRASMSVNEYGYGAIGLWDKDGYRLK